jgi:hypothetical protein
MRQEACPGPVIEGEGSALKAGSSVISLVAALQETISCELPESDTCADILYEPACLESAPQFADPSGFSKTVAPAQR